MDQQRADKQLILLVDDMPVNIQVLAETLKDEYRIKTALSGPAALELAARADRPDLILLDMMMPGMDGIEVLHRLRERPETADIPVIFVTADLTEQSQLDGLKLGADDYLCKPVVMTVLQVRVRNLLQRKQIERKLHLASHVFNYSGEAIVITDAENRIVEVNPAFTGMSGYDPEDVKGKNPNMLSSGRTTADQYREMWRAIQEQGLWQGELWDRRKDGSVYPKLATISVVRSPSGKIDYFIGSFTDISRQKLVEEEIRHQANHDHLTGLPNRMYLQAALEQALCIGRREKGEAALMFLDLDRFKLVNDTFGHAIGDRLLIEVARRLRDCVRESDLVARLGGDEFVVLLTDGRIKEGATVVAEKILVSLSAPYQFGEQRLNNTPSIGISLYPRDGECAETMMKLADAAMYDAKQAGRGQYKFFQRRDAASGHDQANPASA